MNKKLHRIIFNKKRGQLMVVAETASAQGKDAGGETTVGSSSSSNATNALQGSVSALRFALALAWGTALLVQPIANLAQAQIVANPAAPGGQRPTVLGTANGLPQVNIQTPSAAGVSRNIYSQFDVQAAGAILNNSRTNVQTQLGGFISANPWLATGPARVILNEVNASNPSQIRGYVEVAGQRAEVIIANPAGINVNGGGFLNASSVTLTTGTPVLNSANGGSLDSYRVQGGNISITGAGLDTSTADYTNVLARSLQANAGLWAKDLKLVTGANDINAASLSSTVTVTPIAGTGPAPTFAVDIGQLGGMYAGKITLIGSESGIGVNNAGFIGATAGNVVLQSNGWLTSSGVIQASGNTQLSATTGISNSGTVYASGNTTLVSQGSISNTGATAVKAVIAVIAAKGNTTLDAGSQVSAATLSTIAAGLNADGSMVSSGLLTVEAAGSVTLNGQLAAGGDARITGTQLSVAGGTLAAQNASLVASTGLINATGATLSVASTTRANGNLGLSSATTVRTDGATVSANQLSINARDLSNVGGQIVQFGPGDTSIALAGDLNNTAGRIASNSQNLTLQTAGTGGFTNTDGKIEHAGSGTLAIHVANAGAFSGQRGQITSSGALVLTAGAVNLDAASTAAQNITLSATSLSNRSGEILQSGTAAGRITTTAGIDNRLGRIVSNGNTTLTAQSLNNQGGVIQATGVASLGITTAAAIDNSASGQIAAGANSTINAGALSNNLGRITAGQTLTLGATGALSNTQGLIVANGNATVAAASIDNTRGSIASVQNNASVSSSASTFNASGRIEAAGDVTLVNAGLSNTQTAGQSSAGSITGRTVNIQSNGQAVNNAQGTIAAVQAAILQTGALNNDQGLIQSGGALSIHTNSQALANTHAAGHANGAGGISAQGAMTLDTGPTGDLDNTAGFIGAKGALSTITANVSNINGGQIVSESTLSVSSTAFDNRSGQLQALGDVRINAGAAGSINNAAGLIRSAAGTTLAAASVINSNTLGTNQGIEGNNVAITAGTIANDSGAIRADNNLTVTSSGTVNNNAGLLSAGNTLTVQDAATTRTLALSNTAGTLVAGQSVLISAATTGGDGRILSRGDLSLSLTGGFVNSGEVTANRDASIAAASITNSGKLQAARTLTLTAGDIDNTVTGELTAATTKLSASGTLTNRGLIDGVNTQINAGTLNNIGSGRIYGDTLSIAAATLNNDAETLGGITTAGTIAARQQLDIGASTLNNRNGALVFSAGDLAIGGSLDGSRKAIGLGEAVNNASATVEALGNLTISASQLNNTNAHFSTHDVLISSESIREDISPTYYRVFTRDTYVPMFTSSAPAQIIAGGSITLNTQNTLNYSSHISAGGALNIIGAAVDNADVQATKTVNDQGSTYTLVHHPQSGICGRLVQINCKRAHDSWEQGAYANTVLSTVSVTQITPSRGSGTQLAHAATGSTSAATSAAGLASASARSAGIVQVTASTNAAGSISGRVAVIRTSSAKFTLPTNSLFTTHPNPTAPTS